MATWLSTDQGRRWLRVLGAALVLLGALSPRMASAGQEGGSALPRAQVESKRARWDKLSAEEQRELRARFERLKGMPAAERSKLAERAQQLVREIAEIEASLGDDERDSLAKLRPRERAGVLRKLVGDRARQAALHLRSQMTPEERQRVEAAAPGERATILRSIRERQLSRLPERITELGSDLGVSPQDLSRIRSGTPKEQRAEIASLLRRRTEHQVRTEGLPPGLSQDRWDHMKSLGDGAFLRVLQRVRQYHPDFGIPKHRRGLPMRRGEALAGRLESMGTPAPRDRARFPKLQERLLTRRAILARRDRIEDLIIRHSRLSVDVAARLRAEPDRDFHALYSKAIKVLREGGDLAAAVERHLRR